MLRIVYWFYYRWSPPYNHIYIHLWFQVLFHLETCFRDNRTRSELAHFYIFIAQDMCVCGVSCWEIFSSGKYYLDINLYESAQKKFLVKIFFRHMYILTYISNRSVIYQDKISKVDYLHTLSFYSEKISNGFVCTMICLTKDL